jgi:hypothetical protein
MKENQKTLVPGGNRTIELNDSFECKLFNGFSYPAEIYLHGKTGGAYVAYFVEDGQQIPAPQKRGDTIDIYFRMSQFENISSLLRYSKKKYLNWIEDPNDEPYAYINGKNTD